jgi:NNP family nitrate/nitrite transporter-like MFS transporter
MDTGNRATILWGDFFKLNRPQIRAFHMSWFAFFLCFFAWFGIAPLMKIVREELQLTQEQVGWCIIASVSITVLARLLVGWLCDRIGPRIAYTWLLVLGSLPVMGIGLAHDYTTFLVFRLMIGAIGASFVITQYHTSIMFAPNCVGTANATSAGWGNLGGGVTQMVMPLIFALFVGIFGFSEQISWRVAMLAAGALCMLTGVAYYFLTQDTPEGNFKQLRAEGRLPAPAKANGAFLAAIKDYRVWALFVAYAACFGIELTINNVAALYFLDYFDYLKNMDTVQAVKMAGLFAGLFGLMNIFARTLGGVFGDWFGSKWGLKGRVFWLFVALFGTGLSLMLFSQMPILSLAIPAMIMFSLCVQMSEGATFSVVPFVNKKALGAVAGIVGAGGNVGAVAAGFLFKSAVPWPTAFLILGGLVTLSAFSAFAVQFSPEAEKEAKRQQALAEHKRRSRDLAPTQDQIEPALT